MEIEIDIEATRRFSVALDEAVARIGVAGEKAAGQISARMAEVMRLFASLPSNDAVVRFVRDGRLNGDES